MKYGILVSTTNTGLDSEILLPFSTPLSVESNYPVYGSDTISLRRVTASSVNAQRWELEVNLVPSNNSPSYLTHSVKNNSSKVFFLRMPQVYGKSSAPTGIAVTSTAAANATNVAVNLALPEGEFIRFANHNKVYLVVTGGTTAEVFPPLRNSVPSSTVVYTGGEVSLRASYDLSSTNGIRYVDGVLSDPGSVRIIERL